MVVPRPAPLINAGALPRSLFGIWAAGRRNNGLGAAVVVLEFMRQFSMSGAGGSVHQLVRAFTEGGTVPSPCQLSVPGRSKRPEQ